MGVLLSVSREPGFYPLGSHFGCCGIFFFSQYQGQRKKENKGSHLLSKKEGMERKGSKSRRRWENMNVLAKKAKQKGTEPLSETGVKLESWAASLQDHRGLRRDEMELVLSGS